MRARAIALLAVVAHGTASAAQEPAPRRPNILFVFTDDHAPHAIGAYGGWLAGVDPTPNIDKPRGAGGWFSENSFCTNSICGPSRAVIQTGKHSHVNGFMNNGNTFDGDQQTFPKLLRERAGYDDGGDRQVAPEVRPAGLRPLGCAAGTG